MEGVLRTSYWYMGRYENLQQINVLKLFLKGKLQQFTCGSHLHSCQVWGGWCRTLLPGTWPKCPGGGGPIQAASGLSPHNPQPQGTVRILAGVINHGLEHEM